MALTTVRTYQDNGYYFPPTKGSYQAATLQQLIFHIRQAMEDREDVVAVYGPDGSCKGIWNRELEGYVDSAGDTIVDHEGYELLRPGTREKWMWHHLQELVA